MAAQLYLSGTCELALDDKFRICLPARHRRLLEEECEGECVLTVSLFDHCLWLYPKPSWLELMDSLSKLPSFAGPKARALNRLLLGSSQSFQLDKQGRLLIPKNLRDFASLTKDLTLVGMQNKFELWDREQYENRLAADFELLGDLSTLKEEIPNLEGLSL